MTPTTNNVEPTTSATERLRALLTERGVEWMPSAFDPPHETFYEVNGVGFIVTEFPEIQRMSLACDMRITPEQAVAATLGRGTCRALDGESSSGAPLQAGDYDEFWEPAGVCSECGELIPLRNYCPNCGARVIGA